MTENNEPPTNNNLEESGWSECPRGEISGMVGRVARQRKMAGAIKVSAVVTALMTGAVFWQSLPGTPSAPQQAQTPEGEYQYGEICCSEVTQYAAAFHQGELDEEKTAQISQHIAECPHCGEEFKRMAAEPQTSIEPFPEQISPAALAHTGLFIAPH